MSKSSPEQVVDFLLNFLPSLLPKPVDSAAKSAIELFRGSLDGVLKEPRIQRELLEAAQKAEGEFRRQARIQLKNDDLSQAVASFPLFDRDLFQSTLADLPNHLREEYIAQDLQSLIDNDWKGKFTPKELREGVVLYLNCLRVELLKVEGFADVVTRLATLRTDQRTEQILAIVNELSQLVKLLVDRGNVLPQITTSYGLFTIPQPVTDFTGREQELTQLKESFSRGAIIIGVSGAGGIGKTELARKLAYEIADNYPDAQMSIDLKGTSEKPLTSEDAMRRLLEPFHMGQKLPDDESQLKGLYQQTFGRKKALLLLDNAVNAAQVRLLIPPAPSVAIITSRQHFSLTEFGLHEPLRLDVLTPEKARELLRGASPKLNGSPDEQINELTKLCGHLPLALRVAASLLNDRLDWEVNHLIKRLTDERTRLRQLKREDDLILDVEATISLSYNLLDDDLKKKFRSLGIFTLPFVAVSAKTVLRVESDDELDDIFGKLIKRNLLNYQESEVVARNLYSMHDLIHLYATTKLLEEKEYEEILTCHAEHFLKWANEINAAYVKGGENFSKGLEQFRFIWAHLYSAYERLLPEESVFPLPQMADNWLSELPGKCIPVLHWVISPKEGIAIFHSALDAACRLGNKRLQGDHLGNLGVAYLRLGRARKAIEMFEQELAIVRARAHFRREGAVLGNLGNAYYALGDLSKAVDFFEQSLEFDREFKDRRGEGANLSNLGLAYADTGDFHKAIELYEQALIIAREVRDRQNESITLSNLGNAYISLKVPYKAIEYYEQSLSILREIGDYLHEGTVLGNLGTYYSDLGDTHKALQYYEQALKVSQEIGNDKFEEHWLSIIGTMRKRLDL